ncbi:MAG TPA: hypothetical protein VMB49_08020 [Acidobacteriaceae bacterium]|nr:hypothetical protein [Acidobacteriaceae bacterium]
MATRAHVHILVLTDKNVACCRSLSDLPIFLCDDKLGGEPDYTLLAFLPFLNAVTQKVPSGFVFSLMGKVHSYDDFTGAIAMAHRMQVDLVVWYSFAMTAASEAAIDPGVQEIVEFALANNIVVIYPFLSMPFQDAPGAIPVAGVAIENSIFGLTRMPAGGLVNEPKVVTSGRWAEFQRVWELTNIRISVPDPRQRIEGHGLAVWTVAAVAAWYLHMQKSAGAQDLANGLEDCLRTLCVPIELQPKGTRVSYGYLDPRRVSEFGA